MLRSGRGGDVLAAVDLGERVGGRWPAIAAVAVVLVLIIALVVRTRLRTRRRTELFAAVVDGLETLRVAPVSATTPDTAPEPDRADEVRQAGDRIDEALAELDRLSRSETSAAAQSLRGDVAELADVLESRLRNEGDPYLLEVRITELRERVRWAQDRLDAAVGA